MKCIDIDFNSITDYESMWTLPGESWCTVEEFGNYEVSDYGRVRLTTYSCRGEPRLLTHSDNGAGYITVGFYKGGRTYRRYIHRIVAKAFLPNPSNLPQVNHMQSGLGKHDNRSIHLEWTSAKDNIKDAHKHGQMDNRRKNAAIDIKDEAFIVEVYTHYKITGKVGETARRFGIPRTTLSSIVNKRSRVKITDIIDAEFESINS